MKPCYHEVMNKKKLKKGGKNVTVSQKAHQIMSKEAFASKPRKTLRGLINVKYNLPEHE